MDFDRRALLRVLPCLLVPACAQAQTVKIGVPTLDAARWNAYKARFLSPEGRIVDDGNAGVSHSEGQGYGLILAASAGDRASFDAMLQWTRRTLFRKDVPLSSWRFVPGQGVTDPNNATDGDLLIAWACLIAGHRWGEAAYLEQSQAIRRAVAEKLVVKAHGMTLLLPGLQGFANDDRITVNPSYYVWPALEDFARIEPDLWRPVIDDGLALLVRNRFGPMKLPADWVDIKGDKVVEPAEGRQPLFGFEGIRVPLYLLMSGRQAGLRDISRFWSSTMKEAKPVPAWVNVITGETAPFGLSAGGLSIVSRITGRPIAGSGVAGDYYSSTLGMLASIQMAPARS